MYPERLHVELTSRCNFKCITCRHGFEPFGEDLSDEACNILINDIIPCLKEIELQGTGESLLYKNFWKVFSAAKENNCRIVLITNAALLNQELIQLFTGSNMQLVVSLDGANESTFKMHRPIGDFRSIISKFKMINEYRDTTDNNDFSLVINTVVTRYNYYELNELIDLACLYSIDFVFASEVRECMPDKNTWEKLRLDNCNNRGEIMEYIDLATQYAKKKEIGFCFNPCKVNNERKKDICISPWKHIYLHANGDLSVCCELDNSFGNINSSSITDIWNGKSLNEFRNNMIMKEYNHHCLSCCLPWGIMNE
jgi:MoaA/NifB/PqqE/SkfB family radical SAM enzyme